MKPVRIIILAVAVSSAALAGLLAMKLTRAPAQQMAEPLIEQAPTVNVLVASKSLPVGSRLGADSIHWRAWPEDGVAEGMITEETRPAAVEDLAGAVVRLPIFTGEPVRQEKIADASNRIMSSLLPAGKRAVATEITVATGAGGFILPNDRVDVIMVRKSDGDLYLTETVLSNIRVLAIDQQVEEKDDGSKAVVGTTATLELTPDQSKVMTVTQQMAERISLALRSVADAQEPDTAAADYLLSGDGRQSIQLIKSGSIVKSDGAAVQNQQ
ncbi:Flp pilus assembly protein CpaB [Ensifer aridi]|uniref:Flp pilus assembly protein CpaB n=1 Tax=Ensifer aridi TaxID=1708715 RepID=UPI000A121851|nr:Flp pilus assembly protein CpaB [Ensifer aridi]